MVTKAEFLEKILSINSKYDTELIGKAFDTANRLHDGQFRKSGEPYIIHPVNVAYILAEMGMDDATIVGGLLHDVVEDTEVTLDELRKKFGEDVAVMVDGVTKIKLKAMFEEIAVAYSNRQIQTMQMKLDMVSPQTSTIPQESYRTIIRPFVAAFNKEFLRNERLSEFSSVSQFSDYIRFNMSTALMLGNMHVSRKDFSVLLKWLEGLTLLRLKRYQKKFFNDRHMDMAECAEQFIKEWIARIESEDGFTRRYMRFYRDSQYDAISRTSELDAHAKSMVLKVVRQEIYEVAKEAEYTPFWVSEFLDK